MKTTTAPEKVLKLQKTGEQLAAEVETLAQRSTTSNSRLAKLEIEGDITDPNVITEIAGLQAIATVIPRRQAHLEALMTQNETAKVEAVSEYIRLEFAPRRRDLEDRIRKKVREQLAPHFPDDGALERAVAQSALVQEVVGQLSVSVTNAPHDGSNGYVRRLLAACRRLDELEAKLV